MKRFQLILFLGFSLAGASGGAQAQPAAGMAGDGGTEGEAAPELDVSHMPFTNYAIRKVVEFHLPKIQSCYEETLAPKSKAVEGKLMTSWVITAEGAVKQAKVLKKGTTL